MFKHKFTTNWEGAGDTLTGTVEVTADSELNFEVTVPAGGSIAVNAAIEASALKSAYLLAQGAVTVKTNSTLSPDDTFQLASKTPLAWVSNGGNSLFSEDVATLQLSNAGATEVAVSIRLLIDATTA